MSEEAVLKNRVREVRTRLGMRQSDLAEATGVARQTIIAIEQGRLNPSVTLGLKIARALREPIDYVFFLERAAASDPKARAKPRRVPSAAVPESAEGPSVSAERVAATTPRATVNLPRPSESPAASATPEASDGTSDSERPKSASRKSAKRDDIDTPQSVFDF